MDPSSGLVASTGRGLNYPQIMHSQLKKLLTQTQMNEQIYIQPPPVSNKTQINEPHNNYLLIINNLQKAKKSETWSQCLLKKYVNYGWTLTWETNGTVTMNCGMECHWVYEP